MNPVMRVVDAINRGNADDLAAAFHPDVRDEHVASIAQLMKTNPDGHMEVRSFVETGPEAWFEGTLTSDATTIGTVAICQIDPVTDTIRRGRFYTELRADGGSP